MSVKCIFLGGVEEVGANSTFYEFDGSGILLDSGLHPKKRDAGIFPDYEKIADRNAELLILSHAHTDHIGAMPFALKNFPHLKVFATRPTRDISSIMLKDTAKLLKSDLKHHLPEDMLSLYSPDILEKINLILEGKKYYQDIIHKSERAFSDIKMKLYPSGHILGSSATFFEFDGKTILHTSDINFRDQNLLPAADLPKHHLDALIVESTNCASDPPETDTEKKRLGDFINKIVNENGSILIPVFALGKSQEMLRLLYSLMRKGSIPHLPLYTGGLMRKISIIYDHYCYSVPRKEPGFEVSDIPQEKIRYDEIYTGKYFKEPSIVLVPSGMMNQGTLSYKLALKWFMHRNFGIATVGYQDEDSPGYKLEQSEGGEEFKFGYRKVKRSCSYKKFRFTSHAVMEDILNYISITKPKQVFVVHGETEASEKLALNIQERFPECRAIIPVIGKHYNI